MGTEQALRRIRVIGGPWPERVGCEGVIAVRPTDERGKKYPWHDAHKSPHLVHILLDDDPLAFTGPTGQLSELKNALRCSTVEEQYRDGWTCCIDRSDIEEIP